MLWHLTPKQYRKLFYAYAALGVVLWACWRTIVLGAHRHDRGNAGESDERRDTSALGRFALVEAQFRMFQSIRIGAGHRGTATLSPMYLAERFLSNGPGDVERRRSSHNTFMSALTEQGIPGAIFYFWVLGWVLALAALRLERDQAFSPTHTGPVLASWRPDW